MEKITLELETITPLFIAGADQRNIQNEGLRPSSLRGLMRWWFRSVVGGMVSSPSILREKEDGIFGNTNSKSKVIVISIPHERPENIPPVQKEKTHPWFSEPNKTYMWFSIKMQRSKNDRLQYYKEGTKFTVILQSEDTQVLKVAAVTLWLLIYFGGIGSRNRRGAGCLRINKYESTIHLPFDFTHKCTDINNAKKYLEDSLKAIFDLLRIYIGADYTPHEKKSNFCILSQSTAKIALVRPSRANATPLSILEDMGKKYSQYRKKVPREERGTRAVLGLPLQGVSMKDRFSSPLIFGVMALQNGYVGRVLKFYSSVKNDFQKDILKKHLDTIDKDFTEVSVSIPEVK
ncbi:MAG: type III-B CRISPR module RAMP protein Cmr1 [Candidatus Aenigmatarchaeota archaeon]